MSHNPRQQSDKGKNAVVDGANMPNRSHYIGTSRPQTGFFIREPISTTNTTYESSDDEDQLHAPVVPTFPTQSILTSVATIEIGQSSREPEPHVPDVRVENPHVVPTFPTQSILISLGTIDIGQSSRDVRVQNRRAPRDMEFGEGSNDIEAERRQASRERQRARRQRLTEEERQEINARRRASRARQIPTQQQQDSTGRREHRQRIPEEDMHALLARRRVAARAAAEAKRNTPCAESIALPHPDAAAYVLKITTK